jgi:enoyl-CoA hydratase/carnithine racemase
MAFDTILFDKRDGIATVTLNRPERLNAMTWQMIEELLDAIADCRQDDTVPGPLRCRRLRAMC